MRLFAALVFAGVAMLASAAKDPLECEVCLKAMSDITSPLSAADKKDLLKIEASVDKYCAKPSTEKENKLCYFIHPIKREISQPVKNGLPNDKICERLKKKSAEICSLRFASSAMPTVDSNTDFSKLRVKDLKAIMMEKGIKCPECLEKADFVRKLESTLGKGAKSEL